MLIVNHRPCCARRPIGTSTRPIRWRCMGHNVTDRDPITPRKGMPDPKLPEDQFRRRFLSQFAGPSFGQLRDELDRVAEAAWTEYAAHRKSPQTRKAGAEFANPDYDL